ncbi:hypothetical protein [Streptomyces dysideae]|uniref:hypothetical protein n=1 Tax=Streptomyces dysideae TaxID=909626 RepID=UPI000A8ABE15|nr:hypothetical protein [Streptomyces dysideae]
MARSDRSEEPLLSLRSAVVFLIGLQAAAVAGFLAHAVGSGHGSPGGSAAIP